MLLKRLEMNGFKSFADKVAIDFVPGMTAVVGPNGSGKSNITEAIRWVLGEQSAKSLRGGRMGDVIFAGSDTRKPINFAEVSLVLENEDHFLPLDYSEVAVTRRIYRNGDSEFLINKENCRLKDIVDLFMDSGLGRESFSIISQGKIDEILNSKPEERRSIFEEAAGVLKYKHRKKQAENKLFETEENLNRVQDILYELEGQLEPLEMQASIAKDYLFQQEELEKYEVTLLASEISSLTTKLAEVRQEFGENQTVLIKLREELHAEEAVISHEKQMLNEADIALESLQERLLVETEKLEQLEGERNLHLERKKHSSENEQVYAETLATITEKITALEEQKELLTNAKIEKETALEIAIKSKKELEVTLAKYDDLSEEAIESRKSDYIDLRHTQTTINNDLGYIERQIGQITGRIDKLDLENSQHVDERKDMLAQIDTTKTHLANIQNELKEQMEIYREVQQTLAKQEAVFETQERALYKHYETVQQMKSRKDTLEELADDYAGFFQGVREVLKAKKEIPGILGALVELIDIPAKYQQAMETALGASAQNVVVEDDRVAREAISFLKKTKSGRATFLPLSTIQPRELPAATKNALNNQPAFIALASEVISFDERVSPVILNALGTTILAKDLKGANTLARLVNFRYRIVTLEGDVVNAGGSMTGGATKGGKSSILTRKHELGQLAEKIAELNESTRELESAVQLAKDSMTKKREELEETRVIGENLRLQEKELLGKLDRETENLDRFNKQLQLYDIEKADGSEELNTLLERKEALQQEQTAIMKKIEATDEEIKEMTSSSKALESKRSADLEGLSSLKAQIAAKKEQLQSAVEAVDRVTTTLYENYEQKEAAEQKLASLKTNLTSVHTSEETARKSIEELRKAKAETSEKLNQTRHTRAALQEKIALLEAELTQKNNQISFYVEQKNNAEISIGRLEVDISNRIDRLQEAYLLTPEQAEEKILPEVDTEQARSKVRLLKRSIDELGIVNIGAIEEFDRIQERFDFLTGQQADLLAAKETLFKVMDEMDEEMKIRFSESFEAIKTEFAIVFPELFGGGSAELVLLDPENLLTTGIDIVVQPPGKKLQNLSLRSGGERALTAIALLFAIIRVRPVPFCILDEVEAALDEANVTRFSRYLKQFESGTQFIVITHRKGTMEEADVLYGVTMQESGVSKLVSVRLEETAELIK
ncbi:chromosome segregation protein SMC [Listeria welshimeri]|uniref:chromosome segregation protein SMC n=1 Tax=Listeria welshimeri TaxID=1643 RepID=UPI003D04D8AA